jgi:hypothetical protein
MLHRILHRFFIVLISHFQIVPQGNGLRVADPFRHNMQRALLRRFGFPGRSQVLKQLWPRFQTRPAYDPPRLCPEVLRVVSIPRDDVFRSWVGLLEYLPKVWQQFREQRNHTELTAGVMGRLRA